MLIHTAQRPVREHSGLGAAARGRGGVRGKGPALASASPPWNLLSSARSWSELCQGRVGASIPKSSFWALGPYDQAGPSGAQKPVCRVLKASSPAPVSGPSTRLPGKAAGRCRLSEEDLCPRSHHFLSRICFSDSPSRPKCAADSLLPVSAALALAL